MTMPKSRPLWQWEIGAIVSSWKRRLAAVRLRLRQTTTIKGRTEIIRHLDRLEAEMKTMIASTRGDPPQSSS